LTQSLTKISLILGLISLLLSCNAVKHVPEGKFLLTDNTVIVDGEETNDAGVISQLSQKPNPTFPLIGIPIGLHIYNIADQTPDSTFNKWLYKKPKREERLIRFLSKKQVDELGYSYIGFNRWLQKSGDAPVIIEDERTKKSVEKVKQWYSKRGWFNTEAEYTVENNEKKDKRASITYNVTRHKPYFIDSIQEKISSPVVDSLFQMTKDKSFIIPGKQYAAYDFENERDRLTIQFRNSGLYYFDQDYVEFEGDTVNTGHKANITYIIPDRKTTIGDTTYTEPFRVHTINEVRVVTDYTFDNRTKKWTDSVSFKGYKLYSYDELKYRPKAITDAISITPNKIFKDIDRTLTYNQISDLRIFKYPNISYQEDPRDSTGTGLIATVLLTPRKKATLDVNFDAYTSTIQQFGIGFSGSLLLRNIFRGAEILEISGRGSVGSSKDAADSNSSFFNISDLGGDVRLSFPRILFPLNTDPFIPKYMSPSTSISIGFNAQNNIGLDRQNLSTIYSYQWKPSKIRTNVFDLLNIQYVRNLNTGNYFNVYQNSFNQLNDIAQQIELLNPGSINPDYYFINSNNELELNIPDGANNFISDVKNGVITNISQNSEDFTTISNIDERKLRLTEDNLIFASNFQWTRDTRENIFDKNFSRVRFKLESAGNLLSGIASIAGLAENENGNKEIFGVVFSQYLKFEGDYIKHWEINSKNVFAVRAFGGIAIPYGNSNSIPFTRSYFAGGANDNRGWRAYDLGPGSSGSTNEFNEANLKIALNAEYRFTILGAFKGAFFVDAGNIWNVLDNVKDEASSFTDFSDLTEIAIASGFGLRYDFGFFVFRLDIGFKTYNPALPESSRWFRDYNFNNAVYNIGINYPF
jgi:outer membrane protein assembly factor BamA